MEAVISLDVLFPNFDGDGNPGNDNEDGGMPPGNLFTFYAYITSIPGSEELHPPGDSRRVSEGPRVLNLSTPTNQVLSSFAVCIP